MNKRALRKCASACRRIFREEAIRQTEAGIGPDGGIEGTEDIITCLFLRMAMTRYLRENGFEAPSEGSMERGYPALRKSVSFLYEHDAPETDRFFERMPAASRDGLNRLFDDLASSVWQEGPETVGWMHQYFMEERKDEVFSRLKAGNKADKYDLPAVTQLFTPSWIASYMAENTIGRIWLDAHPESNCKSQWNYYVDKEGRQSSVGDVSRDRKSKPLRPEDIKVLDPACGCGHLLVSAFDVLETIYRDAGYDSIKIPLLILRHNLRGLDIDERAVEVARFTLLLKAARSNPAILYENIELYLEAFAEPDESSLDEVFHLLQSVGLTSRARKLAAELCEIYKDARMFGSLIRTDKLEAEDWKELRDLGSEILAGRLVRQTMLLKGRYDAVITNPPYMGRRSMGEALARFIDSSYPEGRNDLFAAFLQRAVEFLKPGGYHAAINQHAWMFLSGYEGLRVHLLETITILSMLHLGTRAFEDIGGEVVQTVCFVLQNKPPEVSDTAVYYRLVYCTSPSSKEAEFLAGRDETAYITAQHSFFSMPGASIVYWATETTRSAFRRFPRIDSRFAVKKGMDTGNNARYVRCWFEVDEADQSLTRYEGQWNGESRRWYPYNKGGGSRKWYGGHLYVVDWEEDGRRIRSEPKGNLRNERFFFRPAITWSTVATGEIGFRLLGPGFLFDNGGSCLFPEDEGLYLYAVLAFLNSSHVQTLLAQINPTINSQPGDIAKLPLPMEVLQHAKLSELGRTCVDIAKADWDASELSWHFDRHPLLNLIGEDGLLETAYGRWTASRMEMEVRLKECKEEIDRIVRSLLVMEEASGGKAHSPGTLAHPERNAAVRSFLSYTAGCLLGRYPYFRSGGRDNRTAQGRTDSVLSISSIPDSPYDLMAQLRAFLAGIGGESAVERNLAWIAGAIGRRQPDLSAEASVRAYFAEAFWSDHVKRYLRRPIYWVFSSGPEKAFQAVASYHRLTPETLETMRLKLVEPLLYSLASAGKLTPKQRKQFEELKRYGKLLRGFAKNWTGILKDDGVQANFANISPLLAKL